MAPEQVPAAQQHLDTITTRTDQREGRGGGWGACGVGDVERGTVADRSGARVVNAEWKPGDVAMVAGSDGGSEFLAIRVPGNCRLCFTGSSSDAGHWHGAGGGVLGSNYTDARPLVVIDPEDAEQVKRLADLLSDADENMPQSIDNGAVAQAALREFARPTPRIEEPPLVGALVIDDDSEWWVRRHSGHWECLAGPPGADVRTWAALENDYGPLRILSPGVTP